jgi:hypothetical protein
MRGSCQCLLLAVAFAIATIGASVGVAAEPLAVAAQDFGIVADGKTDVGPALERAVVAATRRAQILLLPCGVYFIDSASVRLPDHAKIRGSGACSVIKQGAHVSSTSVIGDLVNSDGGTWTLLFTNDDWKHGDADISIENLAFDMSAAPAGTSASVAILFYNVSEVRLDRIIVAGAASKGARSDDGIAFVNSSRFQITNSRVTDILNACYDTWGNSSDFSIDKNECDAASVPSSCGVLVTAMNTDLTPALIQNARVTNNIIDNVGATAIWVEGGWNKRTGTGATYGVARNVSVVGNSVRGVTRYHGIRVSDAHDITISHNRVESVAADAFVSATEYDGEQSNLTIDDNQFSDCNKAGGLYPCVQFEKTTHDVIFEANHVEGSRMLYGVTINPGCYRVQIIGNRIQMGQRGTVGDAGSNDVVKGP